MKKTRFTESQIVTILKSADALDLHLFRNLGDVREITSRWLVEYNLGGLPPWSSQPKGRKLYHRTVELTGRLRRYLDNEAWRHPLASR